MKQKTIVIGLDGATWNVMMPLMEKGRLPNFEGLVREGVWSKLRSTIPPMTPLAWTSIATGVNPGKHGIYDFATQDRKTYCIAPMNSANVERPTIWDIFNAYDGKVGVINFPLTFPPPKVESFFISGLGSPEEKTYTYPLELCGHLKSRGYRIYPRFGLSSGPEQYYEEVKDLTVTQSQIARELMEEKDWDLFWIVFQGLDWIQHYLWNTLINGENAVEAFYCCLDLIVGRLLEGLNDDCNILVLSDHGFRQIEAEIHLNNVLEAWGYLKRAQHTSTSSTLGLRYHAHRAAWWFGRSLPLSLRRIALQYVPRTVRSSLSNFLHERQIGIHAMIDWSRTSAFSYGYMGRIYIHEQGKYPQGIVRAGIEYESLREEIILQLRALKDPETGEPLIGDVYRKEEVYTGDQLESAPDILFNSLNFAHNISGDFGDKWIHAPFNRVADHDMEGVLIMKGKDICRAIEINAQVTDITPTILYLHNLPVLSDMDGRVLQEALADELIIRRQPQFVDNITLTSKLAGRQEYKFDDNEERDIKQRLRDLGYL